MALTSNEILCSDHALYSTFDGKIFVTVKAHNGFTLEGKVFFTIFKIERNSVVSVFSLSFWTLTQVDFFRLTQPNFEANSAIFFV